MADSAMSNALHRCSDGSDKPTLLENIFLAAAASFAALTTFLPLMVWLVTRSVQAVLRCFSENSMWAAIFNSILWMLFTVFASADEKIDSVELLVAFPVIMTTAFVGLLILYGDQRKTAKAIFLTAIVVLSLIVLIIALRFSIELPPIYNFAIGGIGCGFYIWTHVCLFADIHKAAALVDLGIGISNVLPNTIVNAAGVYFFLKNRRKNYVVLASCGIGCILGIAELMMLVKTGFKKKWFRANGNGADNPGNPRDAPISQHLPGINSALAPVGNSSSKTVALPSSNVPVPPVPPSTHHPRVNIVATKSDAAAAAEHADLLNDTSLDKNLNGAASETEEIAESTENQCKNASDGVPPHPLAKAAGIGGDEMTSQGSGQVELADDGAKMKQTTEDGTTARAPTANGTAGDNPENQGIPSDGHVPESELAMNPAGSPVSISCSETPDPRICTVNNVATQSHAAASAELVDPLNANVTTDTSLDKNLNGAASETEEIAETTENLCKNASNGVPLHPLAKAADIDGDETASEDNGIPMLSGGGDKWTTTTESMKYLEKESATRPTPTANGSDEIKSEESGIPKLSGDSDKTKTTAESTKYLGKDNTTPGKDRKGPPVVSKVGGVLCKPRKGKSQFSSRNDACVC